MTYPNVLSEVETMRLVLHGRSLSRFGDGELKMASHVAGIKSQQSDPALSARLSAILKQSGKCLVGIPNIRSDTPKAAHWGKYLRYAWLLDDSIRYASSFVTRPDSAPWINTPEYWAAMASLWIGQDITIVRGSGKSLTMDDVDGARSVTEIVGPRQHAWADYDSILERITSTQPSRVLIGLGPTATVLAVDLCARGIHAIDLGHAAMFLRKFRRGEPMVVTEEDRAHDKVPA